MAATVQHVALNCRDRVAQEAFYSDVFGFERARVFNAGEPDEFVMLRLGDVRMELFQSDARDASGGEQPVGFKHLCLGVADIEQKVEALNAAGVRTDPIIDCGEQVPGLKVCFFSDPEGNRIELMEGWQDDPNPPQRA
jgi:glyoxylase I family protein